VDQETKGGPKTVHINNSDLLTEPTAKATSSFISNQFLSKLQQI